MATATPLFHHQSGSTLARARYLGSLATHSLIAESELTPKPGLVDRRGSGAHDDLCLPLMLRSAEVLEPFFSAMAASAAHRCLDAALRYDLAVIGRHAERAMFSATGGINTHKGAIWGLGLLVSAAAQTGETTPERIAFAAGVIARIPDRARPRVLSHGDVVRTRYAVEGARGEACANFPHVISIGLPALRSARAAGFAETACRLAALLSIMAVLDDSCVLYRGGLQGAETVQMGSARVLVEGGPGTPGGDRALLQLDRELVMRRLSPGGSADLLAATLFLDALERGLSHVVPDNSFGKELHGAD